MKVVSKENIQDYQRAVAIGGAKGFLGGVAVALPASYLARNRFAYYRNLPPSLRALAGIMVVVPAFVISAETAGRRYEQEHWEGAGKDALTLGEKKESTKWEHLSMGEKIVDYTARHQYSVIAGAWATGIAGAFGYMMRDPLQTVPQKVVQARVFAQGLTLATVLTAAYVSRNGHHFPDVEDAAKPRNNDHSWEDMLKIYKEKKDADPQVRI